VPITRVAGVGTSGPTIDGGTSAAITTTGASLLLLSAACYTTTLPTVSDSKGNVWTPLTAQSYLTNSRGQFYYVLNPVVGAGHTFTLTASGIYPAFQVDAFAGVGSYHSESGTTGTTSGLISGAVTPSQNGALIVTALAAHNEATDSVAPPGFTFTQLTWIPGLAMQSAVGWLVQAVAASINPTWTWTGGPHNSVCITTAAFLPSAGGAGAGAEGAAPWWWTQQIGAES
jgi:hypothetical protein